MPDKESLVSVIIPTRNRPQMLAIAVMSVLNQTHRNVEVIVVDDGSDTPLDLDLSDDRVRIIRSEKSVGGAAARNIGLRAARGEFLCLLDDDDCYYPHKIACQLDYLTRNPDVDMVFSQVRRDDRHGGSSIWPDAGYVFSTMANFRVPNKIHTISTLFRRKVIEGVQFDERFTKYQDWQFNMTISLKFTVDYLPVCVAVWHVDKRPDRLALQDESAKFNNYRLICEIFSDVIDSDTALRQRYYRRLGYLALKSGDGQCAKEAFRRLGPWRGRLAWTCLLLKTRVWAVRSRYRARHRRVSGSYQKSGSAV
jgi:glycosyltransferase involved in cell wall biosynthesis